MHPTSLVATSSGARKFAETRGIFWQKFFLKKTFCEHS